jgi:signal transduction histidine kinase
VGFPDWSVADDEIRVHPDEDAAQQTRRVFAEVDRPPHMPKTVTQAFNRSCTWKNEPSSAVGLRSALRFYLEGFTERSKIKVDFELADDFGRLSQDMETTIFRMVQECLTNIHRHSGSPVARVRVVRVDDEVRVEVTDSGRGIPPERQKAMDFSGTFGVGIRGMQERIRQLGGKLEIRSSSKGTAIVAKLPVVNSPSHAVS